MAGGIFTGNTTIKINAAISATASPTSSTVTLYTAPANGYAIVNLFCTAYATLLVTTQVGSRVVASFGAVSTVPVTVYVGPSQVLNATASGASGTTVVASGVEFINTP